MNTVYAPTLGLPQGAKVVQFETLKEIIASAGNGDIGEAKVVNIVNLYLRQKDATVKFRAALAKRLAEVYAYPRKTKTVGEGDAKKQVPSEPEAEYINRFIEDSVAGKVPKFGKVDSEEAALQKLQKDADAVGPFTLSAATPVRQPGKSAKLPKYATDGAKKIIANGATAKWKATFKKEGIPFGDFETDDVEANIRVLGSAIQAREKARTETAYA
jgi:hypothetical protein